MNRFRLRRLRMVSALWGLGWAGLAGGELASAADAAAAPAPVVVLVAGDPDEGASDTLYNFGRYLERGHGLHTVMLHRPADPSRQQIPGLAGLADADVLVLLAKGLNLPDAQLGVIRRHIELGKPLVALRSSSRAFDNWKEFETDVLGGNYQRTYEGGVTTTLTARGEALQHPVVQGLPAEFGSISPLYRQGALAAGTQPLLLGVVRGRDPEPVAWVRTNRNARIFYTSLGSPHDFQNAVFRDLLVSAVFWSLDRPLRGAAPQIEGLSSDDLREMATAGLKKIGVDEFDRLMTRRKYTVIDVRTPLEFERGHIPGAVNLNLNAPEFEEELVKLDPHKPYLVHCATGVRSAKACETMQKLGFRYLFDLEPGLRGWEKAGKKVER